MDEVNATSQEYYCRLTDAGAALEAAAHAAARPVVLTHVAVGDGGGEVSAPAASATALVNEVYRRQIDGRERDKEDANIAWLHIIIPADVGGFWIREFGIYAAPLEEGGEPVLYACGNHAPYYKQQAAQGQATTHELSIPIILSGTAEVEISVKDAGYASQLAFEDLRDTVMGDRERLWENDGEGPRVLGGVLPLATADQAGIAQPDGATVTVDEEGLLSALGGNLLLNSEEWITESGTFIAPVAGWYSGVMWAGGGGASYRTSTGSLWGGSSGYARDFLLYLAKGQEVPVVIGAGGAPGVNETPAAAMSGGGDTSFGNIATDNADLGKRICGDRLIAPNTNEYFAHGGGHGAVSGGSWVSSQSQAENNANQAAKGHFGGGGTAMRFGNNFTAGTGAPGSIHILWHDPAKAAGPLPEPALLSVADAGVAAGMRTAAQRSEPGPVPGEATPSAAQEARPRGMVMAATPVTVNLYDPETGQGSVWREEDAEAKLAEGLITEAAWLAICAARAAEERAAWLADPETVAERFAMLRQVRDAKLAATDYLVAPDYPLTDEQRAAVTAYRQSLRDLPAQAGAPWDGGGEGTPWPEMPTV